jgi:hypothetical protein
MAFPMATDEAIDNLVDRCGRTEDEKGFREPWKLADRLEELAEVGGGIRDGLEKEDTDVLRNAAKELRNLYVSAKLMLVVTELAEAMEALREHSADDITDSNFDEELVDSHIRLFALADLLGYDKQGEAILKKMGINVSRPFLHNKKM